MPDFHVFREGAPLGESRLSVTVTDLLVTTGALKAGSTTTAEWHCDSLPGLPATDLTTDSEDGASQFMAGYVRKVYV
jgi:hypothetical protein